MRLTVLLLAAALALVPAAAAQAKSNVEFSPALTALQAGKPTQFKLTMRKVTGEYGTNPKLVPAAGETPVVTLLEVRSDELVAVTGTKADADGVSTVTIALPFDGLWQPKVLMDEGTFAPEPFLVGSAPMPLSAPAPSTDGGGFPWLLVVVPAVAAAGLLALLGRRRRPRRSSLTGHRALM
jgi:hypothetical protein